MKSQWFSKILSAVLIVMLALAVLPASPTKAATAGPSFPGNGANVTGVGTVAWTNPGNIGANDNVYATVAVNNQTSNYLQATNFGFAIPATATINGIQVAIGRFGSQGGGQDIRDNVVQLMKAGTVVGTNLAVTGTDWPATETVANYGSVNNLWGTTWTPAEINASNFGVALAVSSTNNRTASVDYIQVTVTYTDTYTITATAGAGGTITPSGAVVVNEGSNQSFVIAPGANNIVNDVLVNGASQGRLNAYTFTNVTANHTITASFDGGWSAPSAFLDSDNDVTTPANVYTSNDAYAVLNNANDEVIYRNFNLSIPDGATINGIEVAVEGYSTNTRNADIQLSWDNGTNLSPTILTTSMPSTTSASEATVILGGPTNTWGRTWSSGEFANGSFAVYVDGTAGGGGAGDLNIDQLQVKVYYTATPTTLTVSPASGTYGDTVNLSATLSPAVAGKTINFTLNGTSVGSAVTNTSGVASLSSVSLAGINAGVYPGGAGSGVGASFAGDAGYASSSGTATLTVNQRPASVTPDPASKTYGDADPAFTGTLTGFLPADGVTATYSRTPGETVAGSPYTISATLSPAGVLGNYAITYNTADFTITQRAASVTPDPASKTYGDADPAFTGTLTGFLPADGVTATYSRTPGETVAGSPYTISATLSPAGVLGNYNITYNTADFTITQRAASVTPDPASKTYGDADPAFTGTLTGFLPADGVTATYSRTPGETVAGSPYTISATLSPAGVLGNYNITYNTADFTITQRAASVTPDPASKTYGDADPAFTGTLTGFLPADGVTATYSRTPGETVAGSPYTISATLSPAGVLGNYNITYNTADFTITQRAASVTPDPASKTYGDPDPAFTGTLTGFLPADGVTATYSRTPGETVAGSPYTISATLSPAGVLGNYNITYNTADFTINPASATVTLSDLTHTYDGTAKSATVTTVPGGLSFSITYDGSPTAPTDAGSYAVIATITDPNYTGSANDTLVIDPATVTPSINASNKVYDGTTAAAFTCSLSGVIGGDTVNCTGGTANFDNKNVGTGKTVTATGLGLGGADAGNYQLSSTTATDTADITARTLNVTATGVNKVYDGTTNATVILNDDRVGGDDLTVTYSSASFADPNVGTGKTVNVSGISISGGADAGNYLLGNTTAVTTADITPASQTITVTQNAPSSAANGSTFDVAATASSGLPVTITTSGSCSGGDTDGDATITMTSGTGTCSVFYDQAGNANYSAAPQVQEDVNATESPAFTSADNVAFDVGFAGSFTVTAVGNPSTMTITYTGTLPSGVTFTDNGDGTATLSGTPAVGSNGVYNLIFTADNGVPPNGIQNFTLTVKTGPVIGANGVGSNPDTGDGSIGENEVIVSTLGITQLTVEFSQDVYDPADDTDPDDVTNPANYLLVRGSASGTFSTVSCEDGLAAPDVAISVDSVTYSNGGGSGPFIATLNINGGFPLNVAGFYRLFVCGTTSIVDADNTDLALAGDGVTPGTDFIRNFRLQDPVAGGGGGGAGGGGRVTPTATVIPSGVLIPVTGFAPDAVTSLPAQPAESAYAASGLRLEIPSLSLSLPIVGVNLNENGWDVTWLNGSAGYLEGSAYPTWKGNTVLTGHVTDANGKPGPFAYLKELARGDKVYIYNNGFLYVYQVQQNGLLAPDNVKALFKPEEYDWLTLVTCEDYDPRAGQFKYRRMVRATLISVIPAK